MEDSRIVDLYWQRSGDAITETHAKYGNYCYAIAHNILANGQDAEECVNDTWLGAWNAMPIHRPEKLKLFLGKIARRTALGRFQAARAEKRGGGELPLVLEELGDCVPSVPSAAQAAEDRELERALNRFLHTLPEQACDLFLRRYWFAEPLADIAARYRLNPNTVKTSLFRSREKLRRYLEKEGITL
ncbi:RNA polymerase sigma factor [uncultured Dysosmobacter sp.]|uniref:RNA polymerase sigma factor n=1 Tax=uncultured Dysosmobacter sp. TaxID=2591384 RepID=UPI002617AB36|nr:sigma-70 family RNA polymerase sigma factor [uncultured Dysosmobacter sp.]